MAHDEWMRGSLFGDWVTWAGLNNPWAAAPATTQLYPRPKWPKKNPTYGGREREREKVLRVVIIGRGRREELHTLDAISPPFTGGGRGGCWECQWGSHWGYATQYLLISLQLTRTVNMNWNKHVRKCLSRVQIAANFSLFCKQTAKHQMPKQCHLAISSRMTGVTMCLALGLNLAHRRRGEKERTKIYIHTHTDHNISKKRKQPKTGFASVLNPYEMKRRDDLVFLAEVIMTSEGIVHSPFGQPWPCKTKQKKKKEGRSYSWLRVRYIESKLLLYLYLRFHF